MLRKLLLGAMLLSLASCFGREREQTTEVVPNRFFLLKEEEDLGDYHGASLIRDSESGRCFALLVNRVGGGAGGGVVEVPYSQE